MSTLYLMRHAQAAPSDFQTTDEARWLTENGRAQARRAGEALADRSAIDCIVVSPLVRAVQTAEIVAACMGWTAEVRALESLRSEAPAQRCVEDLQALACRAVLAITHEPLVSTMSGLLGGSSPGDFRSAFKTAEVRAFHNEKLVWRHRD